jgi:hypothetical protein
MKKLFVIIVILLINSCATQKRVLVDYNTFLLTKTSTDKSYGFSDKNPIKVGGADKNEGPLNQRRFLNALSGPNGEKVSYYRAGSCCPVKSKNGFMGMAMLDNYRVTWEGAKDTVSVYINMYDYGELTVPFGFTIRK